MLHQVREVFELHQDCTMRCLLPVHQGENGERQTDIKEQVNRTPRIPL